MTNLISNFVFLSQWRREYPFQDKTTGRMDSNPSIVQVSAAMCTSLIVQMKLAYSLGDTGGGSGGCEEGRGAAEAA